MKRVARDPADQEAVNSQDSWRASERWLALALFWGVGSLVTITMSWVPGQDIPQHLAQVFMMQDSAVHPARYQPYFAISNQFGPYMVFYAFVGMLMKAMPVLIAIKFLFVLNLTMVAGLVVLLSKRSESFWPLLMLFPFSWHQQFFQGMTNYTLAVPLIFSVLAIAWRFVNGDSGRLPTMLGVAMALSVALLLTHPYAFLVCLFFLLVLAVYRGAQGAFDSYLAVLGAFGATGFLTWYLAVFQPSTQSFRWSKLSYNLKFMLSYFDAMRWGGVDWLAAVIWLLLIGLVVHALVRSKSKLGDGFKFFVLCALLSFLFTLALPFAKGDFTHINTRWSAIGLFFLAVALAQIRFQGRWVALAGGSLVFALQLHLGSQLYRVAAEMDVEVKLLERVPENKKLLPLVFDAHSDHLARILYKPYLHVHSYYHILRPGGYTPYFFTQQLTPVKDQRQLPAPPQYRPWRFRWSAHGVHYDYFLVRGAPGNFLAAMQEKSSVVGRAGKAVLLRNLTDAP